MKLTLLRLLGVSIALTVSALPANAQSGDNQARLRSRLPFSGANQPASRQSVNDPQPRPTSGSSWSGSYSRANVPPSYYWWRGTMAPPLSAITPGAAAFDPRNEDFSWMEAAERSSVDAGGADAALDAVPSNAAELEPQRELSGGRTSATEPGVNELSAEQRLQASQGVAGVAADTQDGPLRSEAQPSQRWRFYNYPSGYGAAPATAATSAGVAGVAASSSQSTAGPSSPPTTSSATATAASAPIPY
jgi:hypothetical protein